MEEDNQNPEQRSNKVPRRQAAGSDSDTTDVQAIERGLVFEVLYSPAIKDSTRRRYTIANAVCLMETCKGKSLELRGPYDITNRYPSYWFRHKL
ncbi:ribonuclease P protein subunit p30-like isoform X2 [Sander vitreus]